MKINYNLEMENIIKKFDINNLPSLLLHSCCGPCSSAVIERIAPFFKLTILYYNPNIDTLDEYRKRSKEQIELIKNLELDREVSVRVLDYKSDDFYNAVKGFENMPEGSGRCVRCFKLRLEKTAQITRDEKFDYFSTTLSISPHKDSQVLNKLGKYIGDKYNVNYLFSDFKKKNGYKRSVELSQKFNMYRQDYCGCIFSKKEMEKRNEKIAD